MPSLRKLLIVEDDENDCILLIRELQKQGYQIDWSRVETGPEMNQALDHYQFDAIIADFRLPQFNALDALQLLEKKALDIPFIVVTGTIGEDMAAKVMKAGAHDFFIKSNLKRLGPAIEREIKDAKVRWNQRMTNEALRESEQRFKAIFENSHDGILLIEAHSYKLHLGNQAICRMLGYDRSEIGGLCLQDILIGEGLDTFMQSINTQSDQTIQSATEIPVLKKNTEYFFADVSTTSIVSSDTNFLVSIFRDVTEKKNMQAKLAQTDRLASMGMLAAGVAHEINNPLTYILYNLERLVSDLPQLLKVCYQCNEQQNRVSGVAKAIPVREGPNMQLNPDNLNDFISRAQDALAGANRVRNIVRDLRTFSKVHDERLGLVNLNDTIDCAINMVFNEIKYKAKLVRQYGDIPAILASDGRLSQVFLNLLINAAHAIKEGNQEENTILVRTWSQSGEVLAEIRDTGKGITAKHLEHIFEPFFTTKEIGVGSGLGLSICNNIITSFGGRIEVQSEPGKGSRFIVHLPRHTTRRESLSRHPKQESHEDSFATIRARVLIIDDDRAVGSAISRMLEKDHEVVLAESGMEGKKILLKDRAFDLILCDLMMPQCSGMDLFEWLMSTYPSIQDKIVFMTGGSFTDRSREFLAKIPNFRLEKPFDPKTLSSLVRKFVLAETTKHKPDHFGRLHAT